MGTAQGAELACGDFLAKLGKKPAHFGCQSCQSCQKYGAAQPEIDRFSSTLMPTRKTPDMKKTACAWQQAVLRWDRSWFTWRPCGGA
ncbi:hypothetical protein [Janthinobacterium sp. HLX7-2]|uniref:hypothetical protein n=1 Tax=Janthinobacterium sp. HLX7-2 TaxID=1259331 RepID=UPI003F51ECC6